jgi:hypothetical protein
MVIEVCQPKSAWASTLQVVFQVLPKFFFGPSCPGAWPTCLPPMQAGGSSVNSSSQLQPINHGPGYLWTAAGPYHCLAWQTRSHSGQLSRGWGDSQSQPGLNWQGVFCNHLKLSRSVSCWAQMVIREIARLQRLCECSGHNPVLSTY